LNVLHTTTFMLDSSREL